MTDHSADNIHRTGKHIKYLVERFGTVMSVRLSEIGE